MENQTPPSFPELNLFSKHSYLWHTVTQGLKGLEKFPSNSKAFSRSLHSWVAGDSLLLHSGNGRLTVSFNKIFHNFEK